MKAKLLILLAASMTFISGCSNADRSTSNAPAPTSSATFTPTYLDFVEKGKIRIDLFNVDVQFSFGNASLPEAVNTTDLKTESKLTVNENTTEDESYHFIFCAEKEGRFTFKYAAPNGSELTTFVELGSIKKFFDDFDSERGYMAISVGEAKWTKGLNQKLDAYISAELAIKN